MRIIDADALKDVMRMRRDLYGAEYEERRAELDQVIGDINSQPTADAELIRPRRARVLSAGEIMTGRGTGWLENWVRADEESPEVKYVTPCAWLLGNVLEKDMETDYVGCSTPEQVARIYGRAYGLRVWSDRPDDEQREAAPWQD